MTKLPTATGHNNLTNRYLQHYATIHPQCGCHIIQMNSKRINAFNSILCPQHNMTFWRTLIRWIK